MVLEHEYSSTPNSSTPSTCTRVRRCGVVLASSWRLRVYYPGEKTLKSRFEQSITSEIQEGDELLRIVVLACCKDGLDNALCNAIIARYSQVRTSTPVFVCVFSVVCGYARVHGTRVLPQYGRRSVYWSLANRTTHAQLPLSMLKVI
jgi:hypothetical protein